MWPITDSMAERRRISRLMAPKTPRFLARDEDAARAWRIAAAIPLVDKGALDRSAAGLCNLLRRPFFGHSKSVAKGHSRPMHSVPVPINVRCYSIRARTHKSRFCKGGSLKVRWSPDSDRIAALRQLSVWANSSILPPSRYCWQLVLPSISAERYQAALIARTSLARSSTGIMGSWLPFLTGRARR